MKRETVFLWQHFLKMSSASIKPYTLQGNTQKKKFGVKSNMTDLIPRGEKEILERQLIDIHDTFGREIIVYKEAQKVIISSDPSYNYLYNNVAGENTTIENVPVRKVFKARIKYDTGRDLEYAGEVDSQMKISRPSNSSNVRIKLKIEDFNYIQDAKRIEFDGRLFHINSDPRFHGLFDKVQFCTFYLRPIEAVAEA